MRFRVVEFYRANFEAFANYIIEEVMKNAGGADFWYNATPYVKRGWPTFETGAAMIVKAVIGDEGKGHLSDIARAERAVPKLTYISDGRSEEYRSGSKAGRDDARLQTIEVENKIANDKVKFTGKGDKKSVLELLRNFNKVITETVAHAELKQMIEELKLNTAEADHLSEKQRQAEAEKVAKVAKARKFDAQMREMKHLRANKGQMGRGKQVAPATDR